MSKLIELIREKAGIEKIKSNLWDHRHNKDYVNIVNKDVVTALMYACIYNNIEAVKLLLEANADVNIVNKDGDTVLMIACRKGDTEAVKLLLEANADVNMVNKYGNSAWMIACIWQH